MTQQPTTNFYWDFGDDEAETLLLDKPVNFSNCTLDLFIVPDAKNEPIVHLSLDDGIEVVSSTELKVTCKRDKLQGATWASANWDLKITNAHNWRDTLCGGKVIRRGYYSPKRVEEHHGR